MQKKQNNTSGKRGYNSGQRGRSQSGQRPVRSAPPPKTGFDLLLSKITDGLSFLSEKISGLLNSIKSGISSAKAAPKASGRKASEGSGAHRQEKPVSTAAADTAESCGRNEIKQFISSVRFRTKLIGGVDEADVWRKIGQLNRLYEQAVLCERARCEALLEHYGIIATVDGTEEYDLADDDYGDYFQPDDRYSVTLGGEPDTDDAGDDYGDDYGYDGGYDPDDDGGYDAADEENYNDSDEYNDSDD